MAEQILTPSDLYGAGTSNTIILGGTVTAVLSTNQYVIFLLKVEMVKQIGTQ